MQPPFHAMSRYAGVTESLIAKCQQNYRAGLDLGRTIPGFDAGQVAIVVQESQEADALIGLPVETLMQRARHAHLSDWSYTVLFEMFYTWATDVDPAKDLFAGARQQEYRELAWQTLERALDSPTLSPMVWYEQAYFDVAQQYRHRGDSHALNLIRRGLLHDLHHYDAQNAINTLRDLAETHLHLGQLDAGLCLLAGVLRYNPGDIWTYNVIALTFDQFGLTNLGEAATRRGLALIRAYGDEEGLTQQLTDSLDDMRTSDTHGREAEASPQVVAAFQEALALDFDARQDISLDDLCRQLVPNLADLPVKTPKPPPALPPHNQPKPGRNDPCWCGSGKKYKQCHMRSDQAA